VGNRDRISINSICGTICNVSLDYVGYYLVAKKREVGPVGRTASLLAVEGAAKEVRKVRPLE